MWKEDPTIFFPDIERGQTGAHVWDRAREICSSCSVRSECLEFQMQFEEVTGRRDGMWGGLSPKERDKLFWERVKPQPQGRGNLRPGPNGS
jgi:WhiB family redox-sensing transcriptional regulator